MARKIDFIDHVLIASPSGVSLTSSKILVGCNGKVYWGQYGSWTNTGIGVYDDTAAEISIVDAKQNWYLVDGTVMKKVTGAAGAVTTITTGGTGQPPTGARLITLYRNRLVLSRTSSDPHNWFMSKVDDYTDWDYSNTDATGAVAGNNATAGKIGDVITCLIPFSDDYMVMGCSDSVWLMRGDPKYGGSIDNLIRGGGGIVGAEAFARDSEGRIYYLSRTDLMMIDVGGGIPKSISQGRLQKFLSDMDFSVSKVRMAWDAVNKGLWVFFTAATSSATTHLFWDQRMDAFTKHQFPNDIGPTAVCSISGEVYQDRQVLMGGFDGFIRVFDKLFSTDDGTAITSRIKFPPLPLADAGDRGMITETQIVVGDAGSVSLTYKWYVGENAQAAQTETNASVEGNTYNSGRTIDRERARGQVAVIELSNSDIARTWSFESGHIILSDAGRIK